MDTGEAVAPPGVSSPGRGGTPIAMISNMGPRPAPLLGTTEQKADEFVRRVDFAMAQFAEPVIVHGLLRRHFVANMTGLGRNSQAAVLKYLAAQGAIELITKDGEQWLSRQRAAAALAERGCPPRPSTRARTSGAPLRRRQLARGSLRTTSRGPCSLRGGVRAE